jgi:hypothetical protein
MTLSLTEIEMKVLKACLDRGSAHILKLMQSHHLDAPTRLVLKHDNLVIINIHNKIMNKLRKNQK